MELYKKLQQYGQFGEGDVPALRDIVVLAEEVARRSEKLDELYFFTATDCDDDATQRMLGTPGPCPGDATRLLGMIEALVDGKSEAAGFDNLWATLSDTHGRWDEGEIDNATAKAECDAAIDVYKTNECLGRPSKVGNLDDLWAQINCAHGRLDEGDISYGYAKAECDEAINRYLGRPPCDPEHINMLLPEDDTSTDQQLEDERRAFAEECDAEHINSMFPVEQVDDETAKWEALIEEGAFVTMTVPLQVALMVADNEAGDAHANAVMNLEEKLCEDLLEEYGVDEEGAWKINEALSKGGA